MGNEVLLHGLEAFAEAYSEYAKQPISVNIIHAASDTIVEDIESSYSKIERLLGANSIKPYVTNYGATSDYALFASPGLSGISDPKNLIDACRAGFHGTCEKFYVADDRYTSVSADFFFGENILDLHGYVQKNPTILADAGCALSGIDPPSGKRGNKRPLKQRKDGKFLGLFGKAKSDHWVFDVSKGRGDCLFTQPYAYGFECNAENPANADTCGKVLAEVSSRAEEAGTVFVNLLGGVLGAAGNLWSARDDGVVGVSVGHILFDLNSAKIGLAQRRQIDDVTSSLGAQTGGSLTIVGYADTAGEEARNRVLAAARVAAVRLAFTDRLSPEIQLKSKVVGETDIWGTSADDEPSPFGGMRQRKNRRVDIIFCSDNC